MKKFSPNRNDLIVFTSLCLIVIIVMAVLNEAYFKSLLYLFLVIVNICILFYNTRYIYQWLLRKIGSKTRFDSDLKIIINWPFMAATATFALVTSVILLDGIYQIALVVFLLVLLIPMLILDTVNILFRR